MIAAAGVDDSSLAVTQISTAPSCVLPCTHPKDNQKAFATAASRDFLLIADRDACRSRPEDASATHMSIRNDISDRHTVAPLGAAAPVEQRVCRAWLSLRGRLEWRMRRQSEEVLSCCSLHVADGLRVKSAQGASRAAVRSRCDEDMLPASY